MLCYLEGLTHDEAAEALRWPVGTVRSRLAGGRDRLRTRLTRRGLSPSAAVPALLPTGALPPALLTQTVRLATSAGSPSAHVLTLAKGALIAMTWNKLKMVAALGLMAGLTVGGAGVAAQRGEAGKAETPVAEPSKDPLSPEGQSVEDRFYAMERRELELEHQLKLAEIESQRLEMEFETPGMDLESAKRRIGHMNVNIKELESKLAAKLESNKAMRAKYKPTPKPVDDRMKQLEKQVADQKAVIQSLQGQAARPLDIPAEKARKPIDPAPLPIPDRVKADTGGARTVTLNVDPLLFATISGRGDQVTMLDPSSKRRSTYRLPGGLVATITPSNAGNDLFPLAMTAHKVNQLAVFDRFGWSWTTLDLGGSVSSAHPSVGAGITTSGGLIGYTLNGPEITKVVAFNPYTRDWVSQDLQEPVSTGGLTPIIFPEVLACPVGRFFYAYSMPAKKWATLELKQAIRWELTQSGWGFAPQGGKIIIPEEDVVHIFDIKAGEWTHIDMKDEGAN